MAVDVQAVRDLGIRAGRQRVVVAAGQQEAELRVRVGQAQLHRVVLGQLGGDFGLGAVDLGALRVGRGERVRAVRVGHRRAELEVLEVLVVDRVVEVHRAVEQRVLGADLVVDQRLGPVVQAAVLQAAGLVAGGHAGVGEEVLREVPVRAAQPRGLGAGVVAVVVAGAEARARGGRVGGRVDRQLVQVRAVPAPVDAAFVLAVVPGEARAAGQVHGVGEVPGRLAEHGLGAHGLLRLDERALPADRALLRAVGDGDVEADAVVLGGVVRAQDPVDVVLADRLQLQFVAVVLVVRPVGAVFLHRRAAGEAGGHRGAAGLVEVARALELRVAGGVVQRQVVAQVPVDAAAERVDVAVEVRARR